MPKWLHRTTKQFLRSVPSAELPEPRGNYIEEPDLSAVDGQPTKYWKITGDTVELMSVPERQTVDDQEIQARKDNAVNGLGTNDPLYTAILVLLDEINKDRLPPQKITVGDFKLAVRNKLGQ